MSRHQIVQLAGQTRQRVEMSTDENLSTEYSLRDALQATVVRDSSFAEFRMVLRGGSTNPNIQVSEIPA